MSERDDWKEEFQKKFLTAESDSSKLFLQVGSKVKTNDVIEFISELLSSQAHALKERMKGRIKAIPTKNPDYESDMYDAGSSDMQEKALSAIESIEI